MGRRAPESSGYTAVGHMAAEPMQGAAHGVHYAGESMLREDSMELSNDPRFFTDSVIDKRLTAFGSLVVVSTLMLENSADLGFEMKKTMSFETIEGALQFVGFLILMCILLANVIGTYVGVAQPYHSLRLATSGPAGFEASASYYLHKDIIVYRHLAVKCMLLSIPWFVMANGFRMVPKFAWDAAPDVAPKRKPKVDGDNSAAGSFSFLSASLVEHVESYLVALLFLLAAILVWFIHMQHMRIFKDNYDKVWHGTGMSTLVSQVRGSMHRRSSGMRVAGPLDV